jgi:hypothetical protein
MLLGLRNMLCRQPVPAMPAGDSTVAACIIV